jgi:hypothetical protein
MNPFSKLRPEALGEIRDHNALKNNGIQKIDGMRSDRDFEDCEGGFL